MSHCQLASGSLSPVPAARAVPPPGPPPWPRPSYSTGSRFPARAGKRDPVEYDGRGQGGGPGGGTARAAGTGLSDPLASWQWDMRMINATPTGSYATQQGDPRVIVAVIDT